MSATAELVAGIDAAVATTAEVDASAATAAAVATAAEETVTTAGADNNQPADWFSSRVVYMYQNGYKSYGFVGLM